ncbi:hypothetical protein BCR44DRAFT_38118 [Catenaria anguillulae PL171]|uniref:25S rRNA (Uridine(2843)-N(3))-methyltransferase n=1 Tax=Catenaria anguillulae PL171 TaxID=765915 RepID=A0A1Y2I343_9FUNG|nr:hypothetical protein BCR44DRAFT_38118 [Catenaria anguillulae PL171]
MPQHKTPQGSTRAPGNSRSKGPTKEQRQARQLATQSLATSKSSSASAPAGTPQVDGSGTESESTGVVPLPANLADHQALLDLLAAAFHDEIYDQAFHTRLQHIKSLFFERKFLDIFSGEPALLPTYSARYIPYRTLAYLDLIRDVPVLHKALAAGGGPSESPTVIAVGGGAGSELAAFGFHHLTGPPTSDDTVPSNLHLMTLDIGDFTPVLTRIHAALVSSSTSPASASPTLSHSFHLCDVLSPTWPPPDHLASLQSATLVTLMFTLNELFAQGSKTGGLGFITKLTRSMRPGSLLLLADSAGSFSDIVIGSRPYKITVLLDRLPGLKRVAGEDARWWRCDEKTIKYPVKVENMRFFWRVYEKV